MLNVSNSTSDNDDISNMLASARWRASTEIETHDPMEQLYHKAMSRNKSMTENILCDAFILPPTPSDSDDDTTTSDDSSDEENNDHKSIPTNENTQNEGSPSPKKNTKKYLARLTVKQPQDSPDAEPKIEDVGAKKQSTRKLPFRKPRSSSLLNPKSASARFRYMGRRLSLSSSSGVEDKKLQVTDSQSNDLRSRKSSLPAMSFFQSVKDPRRTETIPEDGEGNYQIAEFENIVQSNRRLKKLQKKIEKIHYSSESDSEAASKKASSDSHSGSQDFAHSSASKRNEGDLEVQASSDEEKSGRMDDGSDTNDFEAPNNDKRRKSVKDVFKKSFFTTKKSKKKDSFSNASGSSNQDHRPPREFKRRTSRLEMGIPIEEVFAGIEFKTIDKPKTVAKESDDENDVIEDPDVLIKSLEIDEQRRKSPDFNSDHHETLEKNMAGLSAEKDDFELKKEVQA